MNDIAWIVGGIVCVALVLILALGPRLGWFELTLFGKSSVKGGASKPERGASAVGAKAGRDLKVTNEGEGAARADDAEAGRDIDVKNLSDDQ